MRKSKPKKRILLPDPKFNDILVTRFVNNMMYDGKKSTAYAIFYNAVEIVETKTKENGLDTWKKALNNVMPAVEVKSRRVGGANFQVPTEVRPERQHEGRPSTPSHRRKSGSTHRRPIRRRFAARQTSGSTHILWPDAYGGTVAVLVGGRCFECGLGLYASEKRTSTGSLPCSSFWRRRSAATRQRSNCCSGV